MNVNNGNTQMQLNINFFHNATSHITQWTMLKWTYLVVSSQFDGDYTNIWATFATVPFTTASPLPKVNVPVDPIGTAFMAHGGGLC